MDLAVDEQGLWVIWGSTGNSGKLYASTIDVYKNVITQTWTLHTGNISTNYNHLSELQDNAVLTYLLILIGPMTERTLEDGDNAVL